MRTLTLVLPAVAALIAAGASIARAEDIFVPRDHASIGEALAVAQSGDRIVVVGGRHRDVTVDKAGVALVGRKATLAGETRITGTGVTVAGFRFASEGRVTITGYDAVFERNSVARQTLVEVAAADRARIERNSLAPAGILIRSGDDVVVRGNRGSRTSEIVSMGSRTLFESNRVALVNTMGPGALLRSNRTVFVSVQADGASLDGNASARGISVRGRNADVRGNRVRAIAVTGDDATVTGNRIGRATVGIHVSGSRATVAGNTVTAGSIFPYADMSTVPGCPGIQVDATEPGGVVQDNDVTHISGVGIVVNADGMTVADNTVNGVSSMTSVTIVGDGNVVSGNVMTQTQGSTGDGISVAGDANVLSGNEIVDVGVDGIFVAGSGNTVTGSTIESAGGCGILVTGDATGTVVADCTVTDCALGVANQSSDTELTGTTISDSSLADVLDLGAFAVFEDNVFETLSHDTLLAPHR